MRSSMTCIGRRRKPTAVPVLTWARDVVARPRQYGVDERTRAIVAELLTEAEAAR